MLKPENQNVLLDLASRLPFPLSSFHYSYFLPFNQTAKKLGKDKLILKFVKKD